MNSIKSVLNKVIEFIYSHKMPIVAMASVVVAITTYSLVLPAFTLTEEKAKEQGGISLTEMSEENGEAVSASDDEEAAGDADEKKEDKEEKEEKAESAADNQKAEQKAAAGSDKVDDENKGEDNEAEENGDDAESDTETQNGDMVLSYENKNYTIEATAAPDAGLPEDAKLKVSELKKSSAEYKAYIKKIRKAVFKAMTDDPALQGNGGSADTENGSEADSTDTKDSKDNDVANETNNNDPEETGRGFEEEDIRFQFIRLYDISIVSDGKEIEPESPVNVKIAYGNKVKDVPGEDGDVMVVHFAEDKKGKQKPEMIEDAQGEAVKDGYEVSFDAPGFSVYAIVEAPDPIIPDEAFTMYAASKYFTNTIVKNGSNSVIGSTTNASQAGEWYFEETSGSNHTYYIYTIVDGQKKYLKNTTGNNVDLVDASDKTKMEFDISFADIPTNKFYIKKADENKWLQWSNGGNGFRLYGDKNNANNSQIKITYKNPVIIDDFDLDGESYGIAFHDNSTKAAGMMSDAQDGSKLKAEDLTIRPSVLGGGGILLVSQETDLTNWTFEKTDDGTYYIKVTVNGAQKYVTMDGAAVTLEDAPDPEKSAFTAQLGIGANRGKYRFQIGRYALALPSGKTENGFSGSTSLENYTWLNLVEKSDTLTNDDFVQYDAEKVNVSDRTEVRDGEDYILYTRVWNEETLKYDFYVVNYNGSLFQCYESGNMIQWIGSQINTAEWNFTVHTEGGEENGYYELQSTYSDKYIAPQLNNGGQLLQDGVIGLNLSGRELGDGFTPIVAWDDAKYTYAGFKVDLAQGKVVPCPMDEADDFYFAKIEKVEKGELSWVPTIDNDDYGIKMNMYDYTYQNHYYNGSIYRQKTQSDLLSTASARSLKSYIAGDGFPVNDQGASLGPLFSQYVDPNEPAAHTNKTNANHLFIKSVYDQSGYFQFDSTQNYAALQGDYVDGAESTRDFRVYDQLAIFDQHVHNGGVTMMHGQFFPYNDIADKSDPTGKTPKYDYSTKFYNTTNNVGEELPDTDPRKGESLYNIPNANPTKGQSQPADAASADQVNYFFGMELEAKLTQTPNGLDAWGHDIIFEFSGDDDMWLFVDGYKVIDLGGIHSALPGKVNFRTGDVEVNGTKTTLRELFKKAITDKYKDEHGGTAPSAAYVNEQLANYFDGNGTVFKDYSTHTVKMYYMERGSGASNLYMRMNLTAVRDDHVTLNKKLSGDGAADFGGVEFPFQIEYQDHDGEWHVLPGKVGQLPGKDPSIKTPTVKYKNLNKAVTHKDNEVIEGVTYPSVFYLKPEQYVDIYLEELNQDPDGNDYPVNYRITECGINNSIYDVVKVNGDEIQGTEASAETKDYTTSDQTTDERPAVTFDNHVNDESRRILTVTKELKDAEGHILHYGDGSGQYEDPTLFKFRVSLGSEGEDSLTTAYLQPYFVRDGLGRYCRRDSDDQTFVSTDYTNYSDLMTAVDNGEFQIHEVRFKTSPNGAIDYIPAGYSVEMRDIIVGTSFKAEEYGYEVPLGYTNKGYRKKMTPEGAETQGNTGTIEEGQDPTVTVENRRGWGIRADKIWSDQDFVTGHDYTYFAVYKDTDNDGKGDLLETGSVKRIDRFNYATYYFDSLDDGLDISDYWVYEVELTNPQYGSETGTVTYDSIQPIIPDTAHDTISIKATVIGDDTPKAFPYAPEYEQGTAASSYGGTDPEDKNIRNDKVTNVRGGGIKIKKVSTEDKDGEQGLDPLANAVFDLVKKGEGGEPDTLIGTYTSNEKGLVTTAYLKDGVAYLGDGTYELTEKRSPSGYKRMADTITIVVQEDDYTIQPGAGYIFDKTGALPLLTIKNEPTTLKVRKVDSATNNPIQNVHFALYREMKMSNGNVRKDYFPMEGYEDLVTDSHGIIPKVTQDLAPGTYYITETVPGLGYALPSPLRDIRLTIAETGEISIDTTDNDGDGTPDYAGAITVVPVTDPAEKTDYTVVMTNSRANVPLKMVKIDQSANPLEDAVFKFIGVDFNGQMNTGTLYTSKINPLDVEDPTNAIIIRNNAVPLGSYIMRETEAPASCLPLEGDIAIRVWIDTASNDVIPEVKVNGEIINNIIIGGHPLVEKDNETGIWTIRIKNDGGYELPSTGGEGTTWMYVLGAMLVLLAAAGIVLRRKRA